MQITQNLLKNTLKNYDRWEFNKVVAENIFLKHKIFR